MNPDQQRLRLFFSAMSYTESSETHFRPNRIRNVFDRRHLLGVALTYSNTPHGEKPYRGYFLYQISLIESFKLQS